MNEETNPKGKFSEPQAEPLFMAIPSANSEYQSAYARAAATIPYFIERLQRGDEGFHSAKLRFRDPDESERLGEDRFLFLWLTDVYYHSSDHLFFGTFFEVPPELQKWHQVGQRLGFDPADVFDWMILDNGHLHGGYTLRLARKNLPEAERESYDSYVGVSVYEPLPI